MVKPKPSPSRTYNPIHFEDLDPHRFEDLVRELTYDFRDWQSIEATGRSGGDAGFDIRAYERVLSPPVEDQEETESQPSRPMDGNLWMIQVKREKSLGPSALLKILDDVDPINPPYGYVLAAPTGFSKRSYDAFRSRLSEKGVMEFYLWGKPELEHMLHLPKNDRLLFTFFGVSLTSRRRSRATDVRAVVGVKNKLHRILGTPEHGFHKRVLLRDIHDTHYPYKSEYGDFEKKPRWLVCTAFLHHPKGLWVDARQNYAYVEQETKQWDYTGAINLLENWSSMPDDEREATAARDERVKELWSFFRRGHQAKLVVKKFVAYEHMILVDPDGDGRHHMPHIYLDFSPERGPFGGAYGVLQTSAGEIELTDEWKRIERFPLEFSDKPHPVRIHSDQKVRLDPETLKALKEYSLDEETLFATDDKYDFLEQRDVVQLYDPSEERFIQITSKFSSTVERYLEAHSHPYRAKVAMRRQLGREPSVSDTITVLEFQRTHKTRWEKN